VRIPAAILVVLALAGGSCAPATRTTYRLDPSSGKLATWNGRTADEVTKVWGPPTERESDGQGGTIFVYREQLPISTSVEGSSKPPSLDPSVEASSKQSDRVSKVRARFWIDPQGTVYRFWFSNDVYKKGDNELPAPKPAGEGL